MSRLARVLGAAGGLLLMIMTSNVQGKQLQKNPLTTYEQGSVAATPAASARAAYQKAFVIDDRLSALRREPGLQSEVIRRLRLGRVVYIVGSSSRIGQPKFCRVAVTRRTRGWILAATLALQGRAGEDKRIMFLIETAVDRLHRIGLCRIMIERFGLSRLIPRALLLLGEEADRAAETLTQRARRRLAEVKLAAATTLTDYYLNDAGLDRYSKLHIVFDFNESSTEFVYDGRAYRDIVRRFPDHAEASVARQ